MEARRAASIVVAAFQGHAIRLHVLEALRNVEMAKHWEIAKAFLLYCEIQAIRLPHGPAANPDAPEQAGQMTSSEDLGTRYSEAAICRRVATQQTATRQKLEASAVSPQLARLDDVCPLDRVRVDDESNVVLSSLRSSAVRNMLALRYCAFIGTSFSRLGARVERLLPELARMTLGGFILFCVDCGILDEHRPFRFIYGVFKSAIEHYYAACKYRLRRSRLQGAARKARRLSIDLRERQRLEREAEDKHRNLPPSIRAQLSSQYAIHITNTTHSASSRSQAASKPMSTAGVEDDGLPRGGAAAAAADIQDGTPRARVPFGGATPSLAVSAEGDAGSSREHENEDQEEGHSAEYVPPHEVPSAASLKQLLHPWSPDEETEQEALNVPLWRRTLTQDGFEVALRRLSDAYVLESYGARKNAAPRGGDAGSGPATSGLVGLLKSTSSAAGSSGSKRVGRANILQALAKRSDAGPGLSQDSKSFSEAEAKTKKRRGSVASMVHKSAADAEQAALVGAATAAVVSGDHSEGQRRLNLLLGTSDQHSRPRPMALGHPQRSLGSGIVANFGGTGLSRLRAAAHRVHPQAVMISDQARLKLFLCHIVWPCAYRRYEAYGGCLLWDTALSRLTPDAGARLRRMQLARLPRHLLDGLKRDSPKQRRSSENSRQDPDKAKCGPSKTNRAKAEDAVSLQQVGVRVILKPATSSKARASAGQPSKLMKSSSASASVEEVIVRQAIDGTISRVGQGALGRRRDRSSSPKRANLGDAKIGAKEPTATNGLPRGPFECVDSVNSVSAAKGGTPPAPGSDFDRVRVLSDSRMAALLVASEHDYAALFQRYARPVPKQVKMLARPRRWFHRGSALLVPPEPDADEATSSGSGPGNVQQRRRAIMRYRYASRFSALSDALRRVDLVIGAKSGFLLPGGSIGSLSHDKPGSRSRSKTTRPYSLPEVAANQAFFKYQKPMLRMQYADFLRAIVETGVLPLQYRAKKEAFTVLLRIFLGYFPLQPLYMSAYYAAELSVVQVTLEDEFGDAYRAFLASLERAEARERERVEDYKRRSALFGRDVAAVVTKSSSDTGSAVPLRDRLRRAVVAVTVTNRIRRFASLTARPQASGAVSGYRSRRGSVEIRRLSHEQAAELHDVAIERDREGHMGEAQAGDQLADQNPAVSDKRAFGGLHATLLGSSPEGTNQLAGQRFKTEFSPAADDGNTTSGNYSGDRVGPGFRIGSSARKPEYLLSASMQLKSKAAGDARSALQKFLGGKHHKGAARPAGASKSARAPDAAAVPSVYSFFDRGEREAVERLWKKQKKEIMGKQEAKILGAQYSTDMQAQTGLDIARIARMQALAQQRDAAESTWMALRGRGGGHRRASPRAASYNAKGFSALLAASSAASGRIPGALLRLQARREQVDRSALLGTELRKRLLQYFHERAAWLPPIVDARRYKIRRDKANDISLVADRVSLPLLPMHRLQMVLLRAGVRTSSSELRMVVEDSGLDPSWLDGPSGSVSSSRFSRASNLARSPRGGGEPDELAGRSMDPIEKAELDTIRSRGWYAKKEARLSEEVAHSSHGSDQQQLVGMLTASMMLLVASRAKHLRSRLDRALMSEAQFVCACQHIGVHGLVDVDRYKRRERARYNFRNAMKRVRLLLGNIDALSNLLDRSPPPPDAEVSCWRLVLSIMLYRCYAGMACLFDPAVVRRLGQSVPSLCKRSESANPAGFYRHERRAQDVTGVGIVPMSAVLIWLRHAKLQSVSSSSGSRVWTRENVVRQAKHIMSARFGDPGQAHYPGGPGARPTGSGRPTLRFEVELGGFGLDMSTSFVPFSVFRHLIVRLITDEYVKDHGYRERFLFHGRGPVPQPMKCLLVSLPCPPLSMVLCARAALLKQLSDVQHGVEADGLESYPRDGQVEEDEALLEATTHAEEVLYRTEIRSVEVADGQLDSRAEDTAPLDWTDAEDTTSRRKRRRYLQRTIKARRASYQLERLQARESAMKLNQEQKNVLTGMGPRAVLRWYKRWLEQDWPSSPALRDCLHSLGADLGSEVFKRTIDTRVVVDKLPGGGASAVSSTAHGRTGSASQFAQLGEDQGDGTVIVRVPDCVAIAKQLPQTNLKAAFLPATACFVGNDGLSVLRRGLLERRPPTPRKAPGRTLYSRTQAHITTARRVEAHSASSPAAPAVLRDDGTKLEDPRAMTAKQKRKHLLDTIRNPSKRTKALYATETATALSDRSARGMGSTDSLASPFAGTGSGGGLPPSIFRSGSYSRSSAGVGPGTPSQFKRGVTFRARSGIHTLLQEAKEEEESRLARMVSADSSTAHERNNASQKSSNSLLIRPPSASKRLGSSTPRRPGRKLARASGHSVLRKRIDRIASTKQQTAGMRAPQSSSQYLTQSDSQASAFNSGDSDRVEPEKYLDGPVGEPVKPRVVPIPPTHLNGISPFANQVRRIAMRLRTSFVVVVPRRFQDAERQVLSAYRGSRGIDAAELVLQGPNNESQQSGGRRLRSMLLDRDIEALDAIADEFVLKGPSREYRVNRQLEVGRSRRVSITSLVSPTKSRALRRALGTGTGPVFQTPKGSADGDDARSFGGSSSRPPSPSSTYSRPASPLSDGSSSDSSVAARKRRLQTSTGDNSADESISVADRVMQQLGRAAAMSPAKRLGRRRSRLVRQRSVKMMEVPGQSKAQRRASISAYSLRNPLRTSTFANSRRPASMEHRRSSLPDEHERPGHLPAVSFGVRARNVMVARRASILEAAAAQSRADSLREQTAGSSPGPVPGDPTRSTARQHKYGTPALPPPQLAMLSFDAPPAVTVLRPDSPVAGGKMTIPRLRTFRGASMLAAMELDSQVKKEFSASAESFEQYRKQSVSAALRHGDISLLRIRNSQQTAQSKIKQQWAWLFRGMLPAWRINEGGDSFSAKALQTRLAHIRAKDVIPAEAIHSRASAASVANARASYAGPGFFPSASVDYAGGIDPIEGPVREVAMQGNAQRASPSRGSDMMSSSGSATGRARSDISWGKLAREAVRALPGNAVAAQVARVAYQWNRAGRPSSSHSRHSHLSRGSAAREAIRITRRYMVSTAQEDFKKGEAAALQAVLQRSRAVNRAAGGGSSLAGMQGAIPALTVDAPKSAIDPDEAEVATRARSVSILGAADGSAHSDKDEQSESVPVVYADRAEVRALRTRPIDQLQVREAIRLRDNGQKYRRFGHSNGEASPTGMFTPSSATSSPLRASRRLMQPSRASNEVAGTEASSRRDYGELQGAGSVKYHDTVSFHSQSNGSATEPIHPLLAAMSKSKSIPKSSLGLYREQEVRREIGSVTRDLPVRGNAERENRKVQPRESRPTTTGMDAAPASLPKWPPRGSFDPGRSPSRGVASPVTRRSIAVQRAEAQAEEARLFLGMAPRMAPRLEAGHLGGTQSGGFAPAFLSPKADSQVKNLAQAPGVLLRSSKGPGTAVKGLRPPPGLGSAAQAEAPDDDDLDTLLAEAGQLRAAMDDSSV